MSDIDEEAKEWLRVIFNTLSILTEHQREIYLMHTGLRIDGVHQRGLGFSDISRILTQAGSGITRQSVTDSFQKAESVVLKAMLAHAIYRIRRLESNL